MQVFLGDVGILVVVWDWVGPGLWARVVDVEGVFSAASCAGERGYGAAEHAFDDAVGFELEGRFGDVEGQGGG
jgi:hypothetical protein